MTSEQAREIVDDATHRAVKDAGARRGTWIAVVVLLASIAAAVMWFGPRLASVDSHSQEQDRKITALADQVRALGAVPVVEPPAATSVDPAVLRQAARDAVEDYCAPRNGCRGTDGESPNFDAIVTAVVARVPVPANGRDGENATTVQVAAAVTAYCNGPTEPCRGPAGGKGADGQDGQSPPCLAEPAQCQGADGNDGAPGAEGPPGPSCPDGYTAQSRRQGAETWWVCVSDAGPSLPIPN